MISILTVIIIISIIVLDQLSKYFAINYININPYISNKKSNIVQFILIKNSGAAFGLLKNRSELLKIINIFALTILILYLVIMSSTIENPILKLGIACIMGGGLSNLIDRIRLNYVIDFITLSFNKCPVFNLADVCIFAGVIIVFFSLV